MGEQQVEQLVEQPVWVVVGHKQKQEALGQPVLAFALPEALVPGLGRQLVWLLRDHTRRIRLRMAKYSGSLEEPFSHPVH